MNLINLDLGVKLIYVFGYINLISIILVLLSCRCLLTKNFHFLNKYSWFTKLYKYHCYFWWIFIVSVLLHTFFAFNTFGNPFFK